MDDHDDGGNIERLFDNAFLYPDPESYREGLRAAMEVLESDQAESPDEGLG